MCHVVTLFLDHVQLDFASDQAEGPQGRIREVVNQDVILGCLAVAGVLIFARAWP